MEASKLTINPDHLRFKPMAKGKKAKLRKENIKALIRSKPVGAKLTTKDFQVVTSMASTGSVHGLVNRMIARGEITRTPMPGKTKVFSYSVNEDVKVRKIDESPAEATPPAVEEKPVEQTTADRSVSSLRDIAKDFAWETNSDSLREFVKWYELAERL